MNILKALPDGGLLDPDGSVLWRKCGGPFEEIPQLLQLLGQLNFATRDGFVVRRLKVGSRVVQGLVASDQRPFIVCLLRSGIYQQQVRRLLEMGKRGTDGIFRVRRKSVENVAGQLVGLLTRWPGTYDPGPVVAVPEEALSELLSLVTLRVPQPKLEGWLLAQATVGKRAELYTVQLERSKVADPSLVAWVAEDSDSLGWDVEERTEDEPRRIEVKGSRSGDLVFFLTEQELRKARLHPEKYELQFWGEIDLARDELSEYTLLRGKGYPIVIQRLAELLDRQELGMIPTEWRISRPSG